MPRWQHLNHSLERLEAVHNGAPQQPGNFHAGALKLDSVSIIREGRPATLLVSLDLQATLWCCFTYQVQRAALSAAPYNARACHYLLVYAQ